MIHGPQAQFADSLMPTSASVALDYTRRGIDPQRR